MICLIAVQGLAQEQKDHVSLTSSDSIQIKSNEVENTAAGEIAVSWFIRDAKFVDYIFKQKETYFTNGVASGFSFNYKNSFGQLGTFISDGNFFGYFLFAGHTLHVKRLDENWIGLTALVGEITYMPAQQSNAELWIYSAGIGYAFVYPMQWGSIVIGVMADGAYANEEINLNTRAMLELAIPIF